MVCVPWWALVLVIGGSIVVGFILYFAWYWWLLSRPERPHERC
jgi:hypothetical protein